MTSSTVLDPVAALIANVIGGLQLDLTPDFHGGEHWEPGMAGLEVPAAVVGLPEFQRTPLEEAESQLGSRDWTLTYPVEFLFDLDDARARSAQVAEAVEAFIKAIDTDVLQSLDPSILDARVVEGAPVEYVDRARPLLGYVVSVDVLKLV